MTQQQNKQGVGPVPSTSTRRALKSGAAWIASEPPEVAEAFLASLPDEALAALPWIFEFWALPH
ncbi:MAG: hypothetical protein ACU0A9_16095, partial [Alterinioella nitratireducens]